MHSRHYKGFQIDVHPRSASSFGFSATVTLTRHGADSFQREFPLLLDEDLPTEEEAAREGIQYGLDLIDGLLPWFDPEQHRAAA